MSLCERYEEEWSFWDAAAKESARFPPPTGAASISLSVVVPAKDEQDRLPGMLDDCLRWLDARAAAQTDFTWEIIVVDDGSKDGTAALVWDYAAGRKTDSIRLLKLRHNRGKGGAVRLGVLSARGRRIIFADADGAMPFAETAKLQSALDRLLLSQNQQDLGSESSDKDAERAAVAVGSRAHLEKESVAQRSLPRTLLMYGFHLLVWLFAVRTVRDTQCGYKLFSRRAAQLLFGNMHVERWAFDVELLFLAETLQVPIAEVAVEWVEVGGSKMTPVLSWIQMGVDLLLIWLRYALRIWTIDRNPPLV